MNYLLPAFLLAAAAAAQGQPAPPPAIKNISITPVRCGGGSSGAISIVASNGQPPLRYSINGGSSFHSSGVFANLKAGSYTVVVRDTLNRSSEAMVAQVTESPKLLLACAGRNLSCGSDSLGSVGVQVSGGTKPYIFKWSNGSQVQTQNSLQAGTYKVTVSDSLQCSDTCSVTLTRPQALKVKVTGTNPSCTGPGGTAGVDTAGIGGPPPYTYAWSNGSSAVGQSGLSAGTYTVTVTAANGCKGSGSVTLVQTGSPVPKYQAGDSMHCGYVVSVDTVSNLQHPCATRYLVCAFTDQSTSVMWHNAKFKYRKTNAVTDMLFDAANARKLDSFSLAANAASQFSTDSCTGWYLPSKAELNKVYLNLAAKGKGGFAKEGYWTSVESTVNHRKAWTVDFLNSTKRVNDKATDNHVRAVCEIWIRNN